MAVDKQTNIRYRGGTATRQALQGYLVQFTSHHQYAFQLLGRIRVVAVTMNNTKKVFLFY